VPDCFNDYYRTSGGMPAKMNLVINSSIFWDITPTILATCFTLVFLVRFFFEPREGGGILLRNVGWLSTDSLSLTLFPVAPTLKHSASVKRFVSLQFLDLKEMVGLLWRGISLSQGLYMHRATQTRINADRHSCHEWDSNARLQCSSGWKQFMP
jgi:hypothetical protein